MSTAQLAPPKILAALLLLAALGATLLLAGALPTPAQAQTFTDYDTDDNGLIEVGNNAQLDAIRHDPNGDGVATAGAYGTAFPDRNTSTGAVMGCPSGTCTGYELTTDLTFAATSSWAPIDSYSGTLDGAGHTITGLNISGNIAVSNTDFGMFRALAASAIIRDLGLVDADVNFTATVVSSGGILAGEAAAGAVISYVYARGGTTTITATSAGTDLGGLVGDLQGAMRANYSTAAVNLTGANPLNNNRPTGGLVGDCSGCTITASYAAGPVSGTGLPNTTNGLVGTIDGAGIAGVTNSYCDTQATGQTDCISPMGTSAQVLARIAATTAELQTPTGYTGLYLNWNIDTDDDGLPNYPWNFGTSGEYPKLNTPAERAAATPASMDYDADDNGRIDIHTIAQLYAIGWDPDGDGTSTSANRPAYSTAFAGRTADMGCDTTCAGYELAADLVFPATGTDSMWTPIAEYNALLEGNGRRITDLKVVHHGNAGLFATLGGSSTVRNLALINPRVTLTATSSYAGALVGLVPLGGAVIDRVAVVGGRVAIAPDPVPTSTSFSSYDAGGLAGWLRAGNTIRNSYAAAEVATAFAGNGQNRLGGLVANLNGEIVNSYAYGRITEAAGGTTFAGGLAGNTGGNATSTASYCDTQAAGKGCIGLWHNNFGTSATVPIAKTTAELQTPVGYTGIYAAWAPAPGADSLWDFGTDTDYPALYYQRQTVTDSPPPGGPREALPPQDTPYDPAADHPEIYDNDRYEMSATCDVRRNAEGQPESSQITFDLGRYRGEVILHLALWNGEYFASYESQGHAMPDFRREGQTATVRVTTDPVQTRFLLDSVSPTTNLVLGYADCHTDDPVATAAAEPATTTSTAATPAAPKVYANERYEMTASCAVQTNAEGAAESSQISIDLGRYEGAVILHLSLWNGEYYASYESHGLTQPPLERNGQQATVRVPTAPGQTRFLLNSVAPTMNLVLGYADCHTAGE